MHLFPAATQKEIEQIISKYFKNVNDRFGGRTERRVEKANESVNGANFGLLQDVHGPRRKVRRRLFSTDSDDE